MKKRCDHRISALSRLVLALLLMSGVTAKAQISVIVAKSSTHTAESNELKQIFTGMKLNWSGGEKTVVVEQSENATGKGFYENFIGKSLSQVRSGWSRLVLTGQASTPKRCVNDAAVKKAVAEDENAVGFISSASLDESVKEIYRVITFTRSN